jgi:hypothetical protein
VNLFYCHAVLFTYISTSGRRPRGNNGILVLEAKKFTIFNTVIRSPHAIVLKSADYMFTITLFQLAGRHVVRSTAEKMVLK